jgi:hypothetical protein
MTEADELAAIDDGCKEFVKGLIAKFIGELPQQEASLKFKDENDVEYTVDAYANLRAGLKRMRQGREDAIKIIKEKL